MVTQGNIWTAAGVLLGFQLAAFQFRLKRELDMADRQDFPVWLPFADMLNLAAFVVVAGGVYALPILGASNPALPRDALGLGVVMLAFYPFALVGHYKLFTERGPVQRGKCPWEELVVLIGAVLAVIVYLVVALT